MRAVVFQDGVPRVLDRPVPRPGPDDALVRVVLAGICGTDLEIARGYMAFHGIPGHEFVGVVEAAPDPRWKGKRVVGEINAGCGRCDACRSGEQKHCAGRTVLGIAGRDGAFAPWLALPVANLHPVPSNVSDEAAVFTEPLAAAHEFLPRVPRVAGARALVLGDGRLGQLAAEALARAGARTSVLGLHRAKLGRLERRGFAVFLGGGAELRAFDLVVEATGSPSGLGRALEHVRPRGTVVLKSTCRDETRFRAAAAVVDEVTIVGSRCGPFESALEHLAADPSITEGLVSGRFPLEQATSAFALADDPSSLKVLLVP